MQTELMARDYSKNSMNFINGNGVIAFSEHEELTEVQGFEHIKKFLDPKLINFSSAFKPAPTTTNKIYNNINIITK